MTSKDEIPGVHIRIFGENTKVRSREIELMKRAAQLCDLSFSEFARMSVMKETRRILLQWREDRIEIANKILMEEKIRLEKNKIIEQSKKEKWMEDAEKVE